jgi:hypothetical protein
MNLPRPELSPLQRRALINGAIATLITLVLGFSVLSLTGDGTEPSAAPTRSPSPQPSAPACIATWDVVQAADPGDASNALRGVTVLSAGEAWAVGGSGPDLEQPATVLLERWDGSAWTAEEGPTSSASVNELRAVDASEPNDVWAVGRASGSAGDVPVALRYDGSTWTAVELPPDLGGVLTGVAAIAPDDVWAVGYTGDPAASLNRALMLHWDGELWAVVDPGRAIGQGASLLSDVDATGPNEVWAVGTLHARQPLILHLDGRRWERTPSDVRGTANGIAPTAPRDAWVAGSPIQRWDGSSWTQTANVRSDGELASIAAVSPSDVWAVGSRPASEGMTRALVLRFDGKRWGPVDGPTVPGSDALTSVDALPDGTVLAVGYKDVETGRRTLAIRGSTCAG